MSEEHPEMKQYLAKKQHLEETIAFLVREEIAGEAMTRAKAQLEELKKPQPLNPLKDLCSAAQQKMCLERQLHQLDERHEGGIKGKNR